MTISVICTELAISIHAPREGGDGKFIYLRRRPDISIHAPREGGDDDGTPYIIHATIISIHAPREGGDPIVTAVVPAPAYFNPRPPRGGRPNTRVTTPRSTEISIHAPREGGDCCDVPSVMLFPYFNPRPPRGGRPTTSTSCGIPLRFQSTPPARGATTLCRVFLIGCEISIHAPREGGDCVRAGRRIRPNDFNPRPPRGGRPVQVRPITVHQSLFQSTPPARGATR